MKILLILSMFLSSSAALFAQVPPPPNYHGNGTPGAPSALPVDQYLLYLLAFACIAGIYFLRKKPALTN